MSEAAKLLRREAEQCRITAHNYAREAHELATRGVELMARSRDRAATAARFDAAALQLETTNPKEN